MARAGASLNAVRAALDEPSRPGPTHLLPQYPSLTRFTASYPLYRVTSGSTVVTFHVYRAPRVVLSGRRTSLS